MFISKATSMQQNKNNCKNWDLSESKQFYWFYVL